MIVAGREARNKKLSFDYEQVNEAPSFCNLLPRPLTWPEIQALSAADELQQMADKAAADQASAFADLDAKTAIRDAARKKHQVNLKASSTPSCTIMFTVLWLVLFRR